jgi:hypothetical protein
MAEKKLFTKLNKLILVCCLLSNSQHPQNNDIVLPLRLPLVAPPLHTPLHPRRLFLVDCCVENADWQPPKAKASPKSLFFFRCSI